jgi:prepilin-type N-terminal cleavage/methylation domain-containing protein
MIRDTKTEVRSQESGERGFSLIEIIITLVVLSIAAVGVLSVFSVGMKGSADPLLTNQAVQLAQEKMDTIMGDRSNSARGFGWIAAAANPYAAENPITGFPAFNRNVTIYCVSPPPPANALNTSTGAPPCASGYAHITVTVTNTTIGSITAETVITNY